MFEIKIYPDEVLKKEAKPVTEFNQELREFVNRMFETMYKRGGVGLAANQVGHLKRVVILDLNAGKPEQGKVSHVSCNATRAAHMLGGLLRPGRPGASSS